ncbi:hypothetical protein LCGC14_2277960 [marine sediment metagenome]|uniref:Aminotransferase class I/classII large domain-containing protein n=1 Tax=marine sediment metagenome TaxID=412755 RepID=A0A0F9DH87_9ZZZZ
MGNKDLYKYLIKDEVRYLQRRADVVDNPSAYLRFDVNERICPFNKKLLNELKNSITDKHLSSYPDLTETYKKLSKFLKVKQEEIFLTSGSDLPIKSIYESCIGKGDSVVMPSPCYAMSQVYALMFGAIVKTVRIKNNWEFDIEKMLSSIDGNTKLFILESPSGTTGMTVPDEEVMNAAKYLLSRNIILLIDEAYLYKNERKLSVSEIINKYPNIIISKSLSKTGGLAGLRIGYLIGNSGLMKYISKVRPMHEITSFSALAFCWVMDNPLIIDEYLQHLEDSKKYLKKNLDRFDIEVKNTCANFMLLHFNDDKIKDTICELKDREKILLKTPFKEKPLKGWMRLTVGTTDQSKKIISIIERHYGK